MRSFVLLAALALISGPAVAAKKPQPALPGTPEVAVVPPLTPENTLQLQLSTGGPVVIQLRPDKAPMSVARVKELARSGFYNGLSFHRVIDGFMAQGGDPKGDGSGGSQLPDLKGEFNDLPHLRGAVAMARAQDPNSANSQFYIMFQPRFSLDKNYTVIGRVVSGMQYVDAIERGEPPANPTKIVSATIAGPDTTPPPAAAAAAPAPASASAPAAAPAAGGRVEGPADAPAGGAPSE